MEFCSRAAQAQAILPGSAVRAHAYVFLPVPKRLWGRNEFNLAWASEAELEAVKAARRVGVVSRLYNPAAADGSILVHRGPAGATDALDALLAAFSPRWRVDDAGAPRVAVCTQGTRDRCCAKWGFAAHRQAQALYAQGASPYAPLECSHLGGDRYAATGVFFPSGHMYAYLDGADLPALVAAEEAGAFTLAHYRGCVFEPPLLQVVRAGLVRDGLIGPAAGPITILDGEPPGPVRVALDGGARFGVQLREVEIAFYASCDHLDLDRRSRGRRLVYQHAEPL